jgi:hypothetical protein
MFDALPKNTHGHLGHSTVRYALHRLFIMRHGWNVRGLGRHAEESNITSAAGVLKDHVPSYIQNLFENRLGDKGLGLHELAVMASTLEHLIHKEAVTKLRDVYQIFQKFPLQELTSNAADEFFDTYMMTLILGENLTNLTSFEARALNHEMPELYLPWRDTQKFVRRIRSNVTQSTQPGPMDFAAMSRVIEVVGEEFGNFQNIECHQLKQALVKMEIGGSGRVRLSDFYKPAMDGGWQFQESVGYLRKLGALDESDPNAMSVIIVNYLHSQTNCIASSGYYSICCKDECENLLGQLEEKLAAPEARAAAVVALVEGMASSTVDSSRKLSANLLNRLNDIADLHNGMIPLHGRLFAQWMHHAYPRECPYPHMSGTTRQQTADEWLLESGSDSVATVEEMSEFTNQTSSLATEQDSDVVPWSPEEELLVVRPQQPSVHAGSLFARLRPAVLLLAACGLAYGAVQSVRSTAKAGCDVGNAKFLV